MSDHSKVAIFWDYENCNPPSNPCGLGYDIVNNIGRIARIFGSITTFRAYLDISAQSYKSVVLRSELQSSGVSLIDCPHNGKKDVVDKMILVDMLAFAVDQPAPATVVLITGDRDYAYALSILRLRKYQVVLVIPSSTQTSPCLESQASLVIDWGTAALRTRAEAVNAAQPVRQLYHDLDANLTTKLLKELRDLPLDDPDTALPPCSTASRSASRLRRMSVRDLEQSRHSKNTASLDSTQEFTHNPASPRKSMSTASDSVSGGLSIPKTPSHSRRASVSTGSTRARSATIVAQSPAAVELDIPAKNPPPLSTRRSSASDTIDAPGPTKRSLSVLPSLDVLELSSHDSRPPSSIIVRSPLEPVRSGGDTLVPERPDAPSFHRPNRTGSPFEMPKAPTGLGSTPNPYCKPAHTMVEPTSPIMPPPGTLAEAVGAVCETPPKRDIAVPEEIEHPTGLHIEHDGEEFERASVPHQAHYSQEGVRKATHSPKSNYHSYAAPHTTYSPSSQNVALHLANTPPGKAASLPPPIFSGIGSDVDATQFAAFPHVSNTPDCSASGSDSVLCPTGSQRASTPSATAESHEIDESEWSQTWTMFKPLIHLLLAARERGIDRPSRSTIATELVQSDKQVYRRAGATRFRDYTALAEQAGIIELGGKEGDAWIALHANWFGTDDNLAHFHFNRVSSPTSDPPSAIQDPSLMGSNTPLIEQPVIFQTPPSASPKRRSLECSSALPNAPANQQDGASRARIPTPFQPLVDILARIRAEGCHQTLRSVIGQSLGKDVYAQAGVSGFKEYVHQASEAQLVQCGGVGGHAWIGLHPELRV